MKEHDSGNIPGIKISSRSELAYIINMIKSLQNSESNFLCFGIKQIGCYDLRGCIWKTDCLRFSRRNVAS